MKLIYVDDETNYLTTTCKILEKNNFDVEGFSNGYEASKYIQEKSSEIDIIVTDMKMPGVHGMMMLFNAQAMVPHAHVIVFSGNTKEQNEKDYGDKISVPYFKKPISEDFINYLKSLEPKERVEKKTSESNGKSSSFNLDSLDKLAGLYQKYNEHKYNFILYEFQLDDIRPKDFVNNGSGEDFFVVFNHLTGDDIKTKNAIISGFKKQYGFWGEKVRARLKDFIKPFEFDVGDGAPAVIFLNGPGSCLLNLKATGKDIEGKNKLVFKNFKLEVEPELKLTIDGDEIVLNQYTGVLEDHIGNNLDYVVKISKSFRNAAIRYKSAHIQNFWFFRAFNHNYLDFRMQFCDPISLNLQTETVKINTLFRDEVDLKFKESETGEFRYLGPGFNFSAKCDPKIPSRTRILSDKFIPDSLKLELVYDEQAMHFSLLKNDKLVEIDKKNTFYQNESINDEYEFSNHDIYRSSSDILYIWGYIVRKRFDEIDEVGTQSESQVESEDDKKTWFKKIFG